MKKQRLCRLCKQPLDKDSKEDTHFFCDWEETISELKFRDSEY